MSWGNESKYRSGTMSIRRPETIDARPYISTGHLPPADLVTELVAEAHERFRWNDDGMNSDVYPALSRAARKLFGICVAGVNGNIFSAGDSDHEFAIMSVSKPFVFALVCQDLGPEVAREKLGVNATGFPFNSLAAVERSRDGRTNPMVNPGAIATTSLVRGANANARWRSIHQGLSRFAGRSLTLDNE